MPVPWIEKRSGLQLADSQRAAIRLALMAKALVVTAARVSARQPDQAGFLGIMAH